MNERWLWFCLWWSHPFIEWNAQLVSIRMLQKLWNMEIVLQLFCFTLFHHYYRTIFNVQRSSETSTHRIVYFGDTKTLCILMCVRAAVTLWPMPLTNIACWLGCVLPFSPWTLYQHCWTCSSMALIVCWFLLCITQTRHIFQIRNVFAFERPHLISFNITNSIN